MAKAKGGLGKGLGALLGESLMAGEGEESGVSTLIDVVRAEGR